MGPQGSGKTTLARIIAEKLGMCVVKTGDLVREKAKEDSETGRSLRYSLETGDLSDDRVVANLLKADLNHPKCQNGVVIDGYPRRLSQLNVFDPEFDQVFYLDVSDQVAIERMLKRGREDDTPKIIKERLRIFHQETQDVLDYYQKQGILIKVEGSQGIEKVSGAILAALSKA